MLPDSKETANGWHRGSLGGNAWAPWFPQQLNWQGDQSPTEAASKNSFSSRLLAWPSNRHYLNRTKALEAHWWI